MTFELLVLVVGVIIAGCMLVVAVVAQGFKGLSPRGRGNLPHKFYGILGDGSIPAWAGEPPYNGVAGLRLIQSVYISYTSNRDVAARLARLTGILGCD